jgi:NADPH:quinone reductase-like Zn-dependent oxidoreductase
VINMAEAQPTVRGVQNATTGDSSVLEVVTRPWPARKKGQVLVKNMATSVNPVDAKVSRRPALPPAAAVLTGPAPG